MIGRGRSVAAAMALACLLVICAQPSAADPLHKFGGDGTWRHEDSGWLFPKQVGGFARLDAPYTIDGNSDVGARYEQVANGVHTAAAVSVCAVDSFAQEADFERAKAAILRDVPVGASLRLASEGPFSVPAEPAMQGMLATYLLTTPAGESELRLYFVAASGWAVAIKTTASDAASTAMLETFVRDQSWQRLGIPGNHGVGS